MKIIHNDIPPTVIEIHELVFDLKMTIFFFFFDFTSKVNEPSDFTKLSPLMVAVQAKQDKCVTKLLQCGATLKSQDKDGNTVFHYAVESTVDIIEVRQFEHLLFFFFCCLLGFNTLNIDISGK